VLVSASFTLRLLGIPQVNWGTLPIIPIAMNSGRYFPPARRQTMIGSKQVRNTILMGSAGFALLPMLLIAPLAAEPPIRSNSALFSSQDPAARRTLEALAHAIHEPIIRAPGANAASPSTSSESAAMRPAVLRATPPKNVEPSALPPAAETVHEPAGAGNPLRAGGYRPSEQATPALAPNPLRGARY
jgi:hypothetical protein